MNMQTPSTIDADDMMDMQSIRALLAQVQHGARVATAVGEPVQVGDTTVISAAEVSFGGGGGGWRPDKREQGIGGGLGIHIKPVGSWVISPKGTTWLPALDINRAIIITGTVLTVLLLTLKVLIPHRR